MAEALILDCEALNVLARPTERGDSADRARAVLAAAHERRALVRVPAPVLAEVYRGGRYDAAMDHLLNGKGLIVVPLARDLARTAGGLLARAKLGSAHAVDALVVATALSFDAALIATGDPRDLRRLAGGHSNVRIFPIQGFKYSALTCVSARRLGSTAGKVHREARKEAGAVPRARF